MSRKPSRSHRRPADENRQRRLHVLTEFDRMMGEQLDPEFTGHIEIFVPAKGGRLGEPQFTVKRYGTRP